jgi:dolichol kinase
MKWEIIRKSTHISGFAVPLLYYLTNRTVTLLFLGVFLVIFILFDYYRIAYLQNIPIVGYFVKKITRKHERNGLGAQVYFTVGALIVVFFLEKNIAITSILMLIVGDALAAINGKIFGKIKIYKDKTLIGTVSCFFSCFIIGYIILGFSVGILGGLVAAAAELQDLVNDNFAIPVFAGTAMHLFLGVL